MEVEVDNSGVGFTKIRREGMIMSNEERILALEKEVAELKRQLEERPKFKPEDSNGERSKGLSKQKS